MAKRKTTGRPDSRLAGKRHEHPLLPIEYGHPVTVTNADVPVGLTAENVAVVEMAGARFRSLSGNDFPLSDWIAAFDVVKTRYGDCFDFVVFFTDPRLPQIPYSGYHRGVYNEVTGINRTSFNDRATWGSERLQSHVWMGRFSLGTLLQEVGHRWGSFARYRLTKTSARRTDHLLSGGGHWARAFDDGDSPMDYDEERHIRQATTRWLREPIGGFEFRYCNLDLYLMGLMAPAEVGSFVLIRNYTEIGPPLPGGRQVVRGTARTLATRNVVWSEGARAPACADSQKRFRAAFVVVTRDRAGLDETYVKKAEVLRGQLERYFSVSTRNRACLDARLCCGDTISRAGTLRLRLPRDRMTWSPYIHHGLGPVPVKVEVGQFGSVSSRPIVHWPREESPDILAGVQHLAAQVNRDPYDGQFRIVAQRKGSTRNVTFNWWASAIG